MTRSLGLKWIELNRGVPNHNWEKEVWGFISPYDSILRTTFNDCFHVENTAWRQCTTSWILRHAKLIFSRMQLSSFMLNSVQMVFINQSVFSVFVFAIVHFYNCWSYNKDIFLSWTSRNSIFFYSSSLRYDTSIINNMQFLGIRTKGGVIWRKNKLTGSVNIALKWETKAKKVNIWKMTKLM